MAIPASIGYCTITGRFIRAILDGPDPDRDPDGVPIPGLTITFTPSVSNFRNTISAVTVIADSITATTNSNGVLVGSDLVEGIKLVASDDPDLDPSGWSYTVTITGPSIARISFSFIAHEGATIDLATVVPVPAAPGATLLAWQQAVNTTLDARDVVLAAIADGGGTGGAVASVNGQTGTITLSASDIGAQPAGSYATTSSLSAYATTASLTSGLAGKQATGDYATNTALTSGLAGKQASGDYATNTALTSGLLAKVSASTVASVLGPSLATSSLFTLGALANALGYWPIPIVYNTGTSSWPARSSVVPAWFTGWANWHALTTVNVADPAGLQTNDVVVDLYAA